jgi:hypothetical protein
MNDAALTSPTFDDLSLPPDQPPNGRLTLPPALDLAGFERLLAVREAEAQANLKRALESIATPMAGCNPTSLRSNVRATGRQGGHQSRRCHTRL